MVATEPCQIVFKLIAILADNIGSAESPAKPSQSSDDHRRTSRLGRCGYRRVIGRELPTHLIDQIASKIMNPGDDGRIVAVSQVVADGRGCGVTGADVIGKIPC